MPSQPGDPESDEAVSLSIYLDDAKKPLATYRPPVTAELDTTALEDGPHVLRIRAQDALGNTGVREIPFVVQNGPGITAAGLNWPSMHLVPMSRSIRSAPSRVDRFPSGPGSCRPSLPLGPVGMG
jgi:hypothetical protein